MSQIKSKSSELPIILTIDIGSSSIRTMLFDRLGRRLEDTSSQEPHNLLIKKDGTAEGNPNDILSIIFRCLDNTLKLAPSVKDDIVGVGITTLVSNVLGLDSSNKAITPLLTYADTRSAQEASNLRNELDETIFHQRTGCYFHPSYLPAQFRWISKTNSTWIKQSKTWVSIAEYLLLTLFGEATTSYSIAAWTGLLNRYEMSWDEELFSYLPVEIEQMLPLRDYTTSISSMYPEFATKWPTLDEIPWFVAIGDGASANIGCGCISPDFIALTLGSTGAMRIMTQNPVDQVPNGLWNYPIDLKRSLTGGAMTEGGNVYDWLKKHFKFPQNIILEQELAKLPPDGHNLTILPLFSGERSPGWIGTARATIHGLSLETNPIDLTQAMLEAISLRLALIYELLEPLSNDNVQIIANGGAILNSPIWIQIIADVLNRPVILSTITEPSCRGTALFAFEALDKSNNIAKISHFLGKKYIPDERNYQIYQKAQKRQKTLYDLLIKKKMT